MMLVKWLKVLILSIALLGATHSSFAMDVSPLVHKVYVDDQSTNPQLDIRNSSDQPLQVEISVYELKIDTDTRAVERGAPADTDVLVFPPAAIIAPNKVQVVRMNWVGSRSIDKEKSYLVVVEQVPVLNPNSAPDGVRMILEFNAVLHATKQGFGPEIAVKKVPAIASSANPETDNDPNTQIKIKIDNSGSGIMYGDNLRVLVSSDKHPDVEIDNSAITAEKGELFIQPGTHQTAFLSLPSEMLDSKLEFTPIYTESNTR